MFVHLTAVSISYDNMYSMSEMLGSDNLTSLKEDWRGV